MSKSKYPNSKEGQYKYAVIKSALTVTREKYGAFEIVSQPNIRSNQRALVELISGNLINIYLAIVTPEWEQKLIPIRIPVQRGILNYRLLTVNKDTQHRFDKINTLDDLKKLRVGLRADWVTTDIFKKNKFNVVENHSFEGLFYMLSHDRIDYIPRGLNEAYSEIKEVVQKQQNINNLTVHPSIALSLLSPYYIFVSPKAPHIAKRLTEGLEIMVADGSLKSLFEEYYGDKVKQANLAHRKIYKLNNDEISETAPLTRAELWFKYDPTSELLIEKKSLIKE